ncbi:MAG TPA: bifunctional [glutamate--ammonia ligase]-adenylyl-L-tyrosine phosphorylase/[glutamate--ammonia-ligase] adenylyltransferase [Vulgatibacter sp.]|nr:bifunctional [glutamate--ammonia ligase]-adenylyl-L-tyrosine phosphorylase/[glutamate--ammonia-ligase] adenylyltransferase [Vulgatibacter sp.]
MPVDARDPTESLLATGVPADVANRAMTACERSADPAGARDRLLRFVHAYAERLGRPPPLGGPLLDRLVPLLAGSRFLARQLVGHPRSVGLLAATPWFDGPKPARFLERRLRARLSRVEAGDEPGLLRALRRFKYEEIARIAARDLAGGAALADVCAEIASVATVCLAAALARAAAEEVALHGTPAGGEGRPAAGLVALGMGKLGAGELNFSSDVDLVLVHAAEGTTSGGPGGAIPNHRLYGRIAERLVRAMSAPTADGIVFRVDLDLRPEGRAGPISIGADRLLHYYEAKGRTWERFALAKARPVAGDLDLGHEVLGQLEPFVYRRHLDLEAVEEIRAIKAQIDREASRGDRDLKLGAGGIREAEFIVSALQILHGGKDPSLRERGFLPALDRLRFAGLLSASDRDALHDAYTFLRRAEHRVQMVSERQTHELPDDPAELARLARRMGLPPPDDEARVRFRAELARHRAEIRSRFADLLGVARAGPRAADERMARALSPSLRDEERRRALASCGFVDPASALGELKRLAGKAGTPFAAHPPLSLQGQAEALLAEVVRSPQPDASLRNLADFASTLRAPQAHFELLAGSPATSRLLVELFGTSDPFSRYFVRHPELLDSLLRRDAATPRKGRERLAAEAAARVAAHGDPEVKLAALRRFKNEEFLRVCLNDVSGALDLEGVMAELTAVADCCLAEALAMARAEMVARYGEPGGGGHLAVVGLGKLGGGELGYQSDLDLLFLYADPEGRSAGGAKAAVSNPEWFTRLAQRLVSHLQLPLREGTLFRIDTRLRPSGSQGALVVSLPALAAYHASPQAALWERQALLRARFVAGDPAPAAEAWERILAPAIFEENPDRARLAESIASMRDRLAAAGGGGPKTDPGGLLDVEFAVQFLQLLHGGARPEVRTPSTLAALSHLAAAGLVDEVDAEVLSRGYRFLRRLELRMQIVHDRPMARIPATTTERDALARRVGFTGERPGARLVDELARTRAAVRGSFRRILDRP